MFLNFSRNLYLLNPNMDKPEPTGKNIIFMRWNQSQKNSKDITSVLS